MTYDETKELLEQLHDKYNSVEFIEYDPIRIPHMFSSREDIEISGFLASTIAWGNRKAIVKSATRMMEFMDMQPYDFTMNASQDELSKLQAYVHRTFNGGDFIHFVRAIRNLYLRFGGIGRYFESKWQEHADIQLTFSDFRKDFFSTDHPQRCEKHLSSIDKGAACKRLCMYLRWMVRRDDKGVDFGIWNIPPSSLYLPLDVHAGNMSRALGLLHRKQNDWKAVAEVTAALRRYDAEDPVKYDFSLFGAGISGYLES